MTNNKMTNVKALNYVLTNCTLPDDVAEKLEAMRASLVRKSSTTTRKPTEKQKENAVLQTAVLDFLRENPESSYTCTDLAKVVPELAALPGLGNQRVAALLRALKEKGKVSREIVKGKAMFSACEVEDDDGGEEG